MFQIGTLTNEQRVVFDSLVAASTRRASSIFYLNASGGTGQFSASFYHAHVRKCFAGKTYTLNLVINQLLSSGLKVLAVATTGIAAIHLKTGACNNAHQP